MRGAVYAFIIIFIVIIILAFVDGFPAYLALGQRESRTAIVTVTAEPAFIYAPDDGASGGGGGGGAAESECPPGETSTLGKVNSSCSVTRTFVVKSFDGRVRLIIDEGTTLLNPQGECPICIGIHELAPATSPPEGAHIIDVVYDVVPDETTFNPSATLQYSYNPDDIPASIAEESLVIAYYNEASGEWTVLDSVVNTKASTVTAKISRFNDFAVLGYEPAAFEIGWLSITPIEVDIGETINITVLVANIGGQSGDYKVILKINGVVEADKDIALEAGASEQVSFSTSKNTAGSYSVEVSGLTGTFCVKPAPVTPLPASFVIYDLSITPSKVKPAEPVAISVTVTNIGGSEGSDTVVLKIDDVEEARKEVTLGAGQSETIIFNIAKNIEGSYTVNVGGNVGQFTVIVPPPVAALPTQPTTNWWLIVAIIAAVVIGGLLTYLFVFRKRRLPRRF